MQNRVTKTRYPLALSSKGKGLDCADGSTDAASIHNVRTDPSLRSVRPFVLFILDRVCQQGTSKPIRTIIESLIWPFIARRSLRKELFTHKEKEKFIESLKITRDRINKYIDDTNREQAFIQYWFNVYMCQVFKDDQRPLREEWIKENLFSGWCKRFISRSIAKNDVAFIYSLQKGCKRLWPRLSDKKLYLAFEKHRERLCTSRGDCPEDLRMCIRATSLEIFSKINKKSENTSFPTKCVPSGSACLQVLRENGGTRAMFNDFPVTTLDWEKLGALRALHHSFSKWTDDVYQEAKSHALDPVRIIKHHKKQQKLNEKINIGKSTQENKKDSNIKELSPFDVKAIGLFEPGKIRMITKGNGYLYTALQPLQGVLLDSWKSTRFSTMRDEDLTERVNKMHNEEHELPFFCSVDYEAATDLLKKDATLQCFRPLVNVPDYDLGLASLSEQGEVYYPKNIIPSGRIVEGQLMGHPLSFPLLCTINLSVLRTSCVRYLSSSGDLLTYEKRRQEVELILKNVLVNGDDMLFKCSESFYRDFFQSTAADAGLKLSLGKNYLSKTCCMINSQVFRLDISKNKMYRVGYLNLKFIKGDDHDPENCPDSSSTPAQVSKDLNRMINLCPWTACIIPAIFLQRWTDNIVHDQGGSPIFPNWYLPLHLGGLGIDRKFAPVHFKITRQQRKLARLFINNIDTRLYRQFNNGRQRNTIFNISTFTGCNHKTQISDIYRPLNINETEEANPWVGRLSLISDQMDLRTVRDVTYQGSFLDMYRIKPFSLDKIERLWEIKKFSTKGPQLPDLKILDHKGISFSPKKWLSSPFFVLRKVLPLL